MPGRLLMRARIGGRVRQAESLRGRVSRGDGRFGAECVLQPGAAVVLGPSACFWKSVGQNANECMLPRAACGLPYRTIRVKCLVDGVRFNGPPGCHAQKDAGSRPGARTRWRNDQQFLEITHSRRKWPSGSVAAGARPAPRTHSRRKWPPAMTIRPPGRHARSHPAIMHGPPAATGPPHTPSDRRTRRHPVSSPRDRAKAATVRKGQSANRFALQSKQALPHQCDR